MKKIDSYLILDDGTIYKGYGFGKKANICAEIVVDTTMTAYAESLKKSDYINKIVNFTYPLIGNCGVSKEDFDNSEYYLTGVILREESEDESNIRGGYTLDAALKHKNVVGISGIDTRSIANKMREKGLVKACILDINSDKKEIEKMLTSIDMKKEILIKTLEIL